MKNVLVFGGMGFLGHYLVRELISRSYNVTIADINLGPKYFHEAVYVKCDIYDQENVKNIFKSNKFDVVYNLAGFANLDSAVKNPIKTIELNVLGNMYILDCCVKYNISNFVYASSAYAVSNKGSFYGISKLASEKIIEEYHANYKVPFIILRYGSVYSERMYENNYIYNLVKKAVLEEKIIHMGDGKEIREYIHAADAAKLSVDVIETKGYQNTHVILTGTERMMRLELFKMIKEILDDKVEIHCTESDYNNHYKFTPYSFQPSVSKKLTANPHIDMGQGLLECIRAVHENEKK